MNKGNWIPVDKNVLSLLPKTEPYTPIEAYVSLRIDLDSGEIKGLREYARIWKWSPKKTHNFFKKIGYSAGNTLETLGKHLPEKTETPIRIVFNNLEGQGETVGSKKGNKKETLWKHNYNPKPNTKDLKDKKTIVSTPEKNGVETTPNGHHEPNGKPKKKPMKEFPEDSFELKVSKWFHERMSEHYPPKNFKFMRDVDFQTWAREVDKMKRIDQKSEDDIVNVLNFILEDDFWRQNARSIATLRNKGKNGCTKFENIQPKANGIYA